jgi:hypothetical protein
MHEEFVAADYPSAESTTISNQLSFFAVAVAGLEILGSASVLARWSGRKSSE